MTRRIELPRYIIRGEQVFDSVAAVAEEIGRKRPLVVADEITYRLAGRLVEKKVDGAKKLIIEGATLKEAAKVEEKLRGGRDLALAVGGGSVIDVAKVASFNAEVPFFSIPTTISHDGIASSGASLLVDGRKKSIASKVPMAVFADLQVIEAAPHRLFAAGCGDAISKFTAVLDWRLAHEKKGEYYGDYAAELAKLAAESVEKNAKRMAKDESFGVHILFEALMSSGVAMSIAGSSRPASGAEHSFSHALDRIAPQPAMHGEQVGVGTIMMARLHEKRGYFKVKSHDEIRKALETLGAPTTAEGLEIGEEYIIKALTMAGKVRDRYTILEGGLKEKEARKLAKETGVI